MPSTAFRTRTHSPPTYAASVPIHLPKTVGFPPTPVTSTSRPPTTTEHQTLYAFETHAASCPSCHDPYTVHRQHRRLCDTGHALAQCVAEYVYSKRDGHLIYGTHEELVLVELPRGYDEVFSLLRAMERSLRHLRQAPIVTQSKVVLPKPALRVSHDRTYLIASRTPRRGPDVAAHVLNSPQTVNPPQVINPSQSINTATSRVVTTLAPRFMTATTTHTTSQRSDTASTPKYTTTTATPTGTYTTELREPKPYRSRRW